MMYQKGAKILPKKESKAKITKTTIIKEISITPIGGINFCTGATKGCDFWYIRYLIERVLGCHELNACKIKIIIITSMAEVSYLERARAAGVDSFWYKDVSPEALIDVIDRTMAGEHLFPDKTPKVKLGLADSTDLTRKEIEVLRLVCEGLEYSVIAEKLNITERTVKFHVSNILSKTGFPNKTRLAIAVTKQKFIIPTLREEN